MNKKLIAMMALTAVAASSSAVFADEVENTEIESIINEPAVVVDVDEMEAPEIQGDVMVISENPAEAEFEKVVKMPSYAVNTVTVTKADAEMISTTTDVENKDDEANTVNFTVSESTLVYDNAGNKKTVADVKENDVVTVYTGAYEPTVLMLPAQYNANVIVINSEEAGNVDVDTYLAGEEGITNAAFTLNVNVAEDTKVVDTEDKEYTDSLENKDLIVFYGESTKSIPAQATPVKVVVIGDNETALAQIEAAKTEVPADGIVEDDVVAVEPVTVDYSAVKNVVVGEKNIENVVVKDDVVMVPLREVAEAAGFVVGWNGETKTVTLNDGMYSFKIDENSYTRAKMMPMELSVAPVIIDDFTYVPAEFFVEVTENAAVDGTSLVVNASIAE